MSHDSCGDLQTLAATEGTLTLCSMMRRPNATAYWAHMHAGSVKPAPCAGRAGPQDACVGTTKQGSMAPEQAHHRRSRSRPRSSSLANSSCGSAPSNWRSACWCGHSRRSKACTARACSHWHINRNCMEGAGFARCCIRFAACSPAEGGISRLHACATLRHPLCATPQTKQTLWQQAQAKILNIQN